MLFRSREIDVNLQDDYGESALMKAASGGHVKIVKTLCKRSDIDVNLQDGTEWTALMHAQENIGRVRALLKHKLLDMSMRDDNSCNAFERACSEGWTEVVKAMLLTRQSAEQLIDDDLDHGQYLARESGHEEIIKIVSKTALAREKKNIANEITG